jgi:hypothetical protein
MRIALIAAATVATMSFSALPAGAGEGLGARLFRLARVRSMRTASIRR